MQRRHFSQLLALGIILPSTYVSAAEDAESDKIPQLKKPFRSVNVPEDGRTALFFFDYACPFCAVYHEPIMRWTSTVPKAIKTKVIPVVNLVDPVRRNDQYIAAQCFFAASTVASAQQLDRFSRSVYENYPKSNSLMDHALWIKALKASGIPKESFSAALKQPAIKASIEGAARKVQQYALKATPSVALDGRYVMTPDDTLGDAAMFFNILNGLASEIL